MISLYERQGTIIQTRTETNQTPSQLRENLRPCQIALEIPHGEETEYEDALPRVVFRGLANPDDEGAAPNDYHKMARLDELREHTNGNEIHVPLLTAGGVTEDLCGKFLRPSRSGEQAVWDTIKPRDLPITGVSPIEYNSDNGEITHYEYGAFDESLKDNEVYHRVVINKTGHVVGLLWRQLQTLTPGSGFSSESLDYNTSEALTWDLNFTAANGSNGNATTVARGNHYHAAHNTKVDGGLLGNEYDGSGAVSDWRVDFGGGSNQVARGDHHHDGRYSLSSHDHGGVYSFADHTHAYAPINHTHRGDHHHDSRYSMSGHDHNGVYSRVGHTHEYAPINHTHPELACHYEDGCGGGGGEFDTGEFNDILVGADGDFENLNVSQTRLLFGERARIESPLPGGLRLVSHNGWVLTLTCTNGSGPNAPTARIRITDSGIWAEKATNPNGPWAMNQLI
jgi:hypothetical protein